MSLNPTKNIAAAIDNFERYVETVTGKDILQISLSSVSICKNTDGIVYEISSITTEDSTNFQAEDGQEVEVNMYVYKKVLLSRRMVLRI